MNWCILEIFLLHINKHPPQRHINTHTHDTRVYLRLRSRIKVITRLILKVKSEVTRVNIWTHEMHLIIFDNHESFAIKKILTKKRNVEGIKFIVTKKHEEMNKNILYY